MYLLLIRHAIAAERAEFARTGEVDDLRPLTDKGRRRMARGVRGLHTLVPGIDVLATSPLTRAVQTAEIVAEEFGISDIKHVQALASGDDDVFLDWLGRFEGDNVVAIVGHEPILSQWASWLLAGRASHFMQIKKGSAVLIEFPDRIKPGRAWLHWAIRPRQLRQLKSSRSEDEE